MNVNNIFFNCITYRMNIKKKHINVKSIVFLLYSEFKIVNHIIEYHFNS